jgi:hypothetical protein
MLAQVYEAGTQPKMSLLKTVCCCGSGMFSPDPDFYPSRIPDLRSRIQQQQQKRRGKNFVCPTFFCKHKYHKIKKILLIFEQIKKQFGAIYEEFSTFTSKIVIQHRGLGSEIREKHILDPGYAALVSCYKHTCTLSKHHVYSLFGNANFTPDLLLTFFMEYNFSTFSLITDVIKSVFRNATEN